MVEPADFGSGSKQVPKVIADQVLERASLLDRDTADDLTVDELRRAALEAGMSPQAVDAALAELVDQGGAVMEPNGSARIQGGTAAAVSYGALGAVFGFLAVLGHGDWANLVLLGSFLTTIQLIVRHVRSGRLGPLLKEATILWAVYSVAWVVGGGDLDLPFLALPLLGLSLAAIGGAVARALSPRRDEGGPELSVAGSVPLPPVTDGQQE